MNFNEIAYVNRLVKAEETIAGLISGQEQLLKKIKLLEQTKNKDKTPKELCELEPKKKICRKIFYYLQDIKHTFENELIRIEGGEPGWSDFSSTYDDVEVLIDLVKEFYDEEE